MSAPTPKQREERDNCQLCKGHRGGVPGNENRVDGVVVCDYCHATVSEFARLRTHSPEESVGEDEIRVHLLTGRVDPPTGSIVISSRDGRWSGEVIGQPLDGEEESTT